MCWYLLWPQSFIHIDFISLQTEKDREKFLTVKTILVQLFFFSQSIFWEPNQVYLWAQPVMISHIISLIYKQLYVEAILQHCHIITHLISKYHVTYFFLFYLLIFNIYLFICQFLNMCKYLVHLMYCSATHPHGLHQICQFLL